MMKVLNYTKRQEKGLWLVLKHAEWSLIIEKYSIIAIHLNWSNTQTVGNGDVMAEAQEMAHFIYYLEGYWFKP